MRTPEEISKDIIELKTELELSKNYYLYTRLTDSNADEEKIGFFNIGNAKLILSELNAGKTLQYRHGVYGRVNVYMNPQRNRILVSENEDIKEKNIFTFIMWATGEWFIKNDEL